MDDEPVPTELEDLVAELINAIFPRRREERFDFAFAVEDLELVNDAQPDLVLQLFRDTVRRYIKKNWKFEIDRTLSEVRERCSFHLVRPMTEAYFFGEPAAVNRAGAILPPQLPIALDLEQFITTDLVYSNLPSSEQIADMPLRLRHPKHYLRYLCDPTLVAKWSSQYRETHGGVALSVLSLGHRS